jgi:hypothetical protein
MLHTDIIQNIVIYNVITYRAWWYSNNCLAVFTRCQVQILAGIPGTVTEVFMIFISPFIKCQDSILITS